MRNWIDFVDWVGRKKGEVPVDDASGEEGQAGGLDTGTLIFDGGFAGTPTFGNQGNGKRSSGTTTDYAKFLLSIGPPEAGVVYTMTYATNFSALSQQGALAMVGFGFKRNNAYHLSGLKGDGDTGLIANKALGSNFNTLKANSEVNGGAASHGTQGGPNWIKIAIAEAGDSYTLSTSSAGEGWTAEFSSDLPEPISGATAAKDFGPALYLDADDSGPFEVDFILWRKASLDTLQIAGQALHLNGQNLIIEGVS